MIKKLKDGYSSSHVRATEHHLPYGISVTCHPTQANMPHLNPRQTGTWFTCPRGIKG